MVVRRSYIIIALTVLTGWLSLATAEKVKITIDGNESFPSRKLRTVANLKLPDNKLDSDSLEQSIYRLRSFYRRNGFADTEVEYMIDSCSLPGTTEIKLVVTEGVRYYVDRIDFSGSRKISAGVLSQAIANKIRRPLNFEDLGQDDFGLMLLYADHGYIYAEVDHDLEFQNGHQAIITYQIKEGPQVGISRIALTGNVQVKEKYVLNTIRMSPGDVFSRSQLIKSQYLLQATDLFRVVAVSPGEIDSLANEIAVDIRLVEKPRRLFETSIGYGSGDAVRLMTKWAHRNLFGLGRRVEYNGLVSFQTKLPLKMTRGRSQISYSDPYFYLFNKPARGEVYYDDFRPSYTDYRLETVGFNFTVSTPISNAFNIDYRWKQEWLKLSPNWQLTKYTSDTLSYKGRRSLAVASSYENLDDPVNPRKGLSSDLELEYTGGIMGGAETFQRAVNNWAYYFKAPAHRLSFAWRFRYGIIGDWSQRSTIPSYEMFFLGGPSSVRGYALSSIGPVDDKGRVTGGRIMMLINLQSVINLGKNWGLATFIDGGMLSNKTFEKQSLGDMVSSPGLGIRYVLPFGTGRVDFAAPGTLMGQIKYWRWMVAWGEPF
ncbi:MAG: BamA/TamA family outer membrane protein [Candidatus Edwardsbacteria bacterium]|nr:BamA/TamA family outer membrane protein [Candidatus Edwardsbacteria bacterium]